MQVEAGKEQGEKVVRENSKESKALKRRVRNCMRE